MESSSNQSYVEQTQAKFAFSNILKIKMDKSNQRLVVFHKILTKKFLDKFKTVIRK